MLEEAVSVLSRRVKEPKQAARREVVDLDPGLGGHHAALASPARAPPCLRLISSAAAMTSHWPSPLVATESAVGTLGEPAARPSEGLRG